MSMYHDAFLSPRVAQGNAFSSRKDGTEVAAKLNPPFPNAHTNLACMSTVLADSSCRSGGHSVTGAAGSSS